MGRPPPLTRRARFRAGRPPAAGRSHRAAAPPFPPPPTPFALKGPDPVWARGPPREGIPPSVFPPCPPRPPCPERPLAEGGARRKFHGGVWRRRRGVTPPRPRVGDTQRGEGVGTRRGQSGGGGLWKAFSHAPPPQPKVTRNPSLSCLGLKRGGTNYSRGLGDIKCWGAVHSTPRYVSWRGGPPRTLTLHAWLGLGCARLRTEEFSSPMKGGGQQWWNLGGSEPLPPTPLPHPAPLTPAGLWGARDPQIWVEQGPPGEDRAPLCAPPQ